MKLIFVFLSRGETQSPQTSRPRCPPSIESLTADERRPCLGRSLPAQRWQEVTTDEQRPADLCERCAPPGKYRGCIQLYRTHRPASGGGRLWPSRPVLFKIFYVFAQTHLTCTNQTGGHYHPCRASSGRLQRRAAIPAFRASYVQK